MKTSTNLGAPNNPLDGKAQDTDQKSGPPAWKQLIECVVHTVAQNLAVEARLNQFWKS